MELGISVLQAYVFIVLVVLYFNESVQTNSHQNTKLILKHKNYEYYNFYEYFLEKNYIYTLSTKKKSFKKSFRKLIVLNKLSKRFFKEIFFFILKKKPQILLFERRKNPNLLLSKKNINSTKINLKTYERN